MKQIKSKIYYEKATGEILVITSEEEGFVEETSKEQDIELYEKLRSIESENIYFIELEYGTLASTFKSAKSYFVNLETKTLEIVNYTQEELDAKALEQEQALALMDIVSTITKYVQAQNEPSLSMVEDAILEIEKNKIIEGVG